MKSSATMSQVTVVTARDASVYLI